jgi:hypothetical protein
LIKPIGYTTTPMEKPIYSPVATQQIKMVLVFDTAEKTGIGAGLSMAPVPGGAFWLSHEVS